MFLKISLLRFYVNFKRRYDNVSAIILAVKFTGSGISKPKLINFYVFFNLFCQFNYFIKMMLMKSHIFSIHILVISTKESGNSIDIRGYSLQLVCTLNSISEVFHSRGSEHWWMQSKPHSWSPLSKGNTKFARTLNWERILMWQSARPTL